MIAAAPSNSFDRFRTVTEYQKDESAQTRLYVWKKGLAMWADYPILGVGAGAFDVALGMDYLDASAPTRAWRAAHSSYIQVVAELGTAGFAMWIGMIISGFSALRDGRRKLLRYGTLDPLAKHLFGLCNALRTSLFGYMVCAVFLSRAYDWLLMVLLALCVSCWLTVRAYISLDEDRRHYFEMA